MAECQISIVITSYTTRMMKDIYELLDSVQAQSYPSVETIFVAEKTRELADNVRRYGAEKGMRNLTVLFNEGKPGLCAARNLGITAARGDIIAFVDDDAVLFPEWAAEIIKAYEENPDVIGVTGPALPLWEEPAMSWFPEEFYWIISCTGWADLKETRAVRNGWGHGMSFRREAFETAGLFSTDIGYQAGGYRDGMRTLDIGDDVELSLRVREKTGKTIVACPGAKLLHRVYRSRTGYSFISKRSYWVGRSRRMLQIQADRNGEGDLLNQEHTLMKRILTRLFPGIVRTFFSSPRDACRKLGVTVTSLTFVTIGYYSHLFSFAPKQQLNTSISKGGY